MWPVPAAPAMAGGFIRSQRCHRREHVRHPVAKHLFVECVRRLHGDEREQLERMILQHVPKCASVVVEGGAPSGREGLVPDDFNALDMLRVPDGLEQSIGEAQADNVLDG